MGRHRRGLPSRAGARGTIRTVPSTSATITSVRVVWQGRTSGRSPDFADVLDAWAWVLEQVGGLSVDLERILFVEEIQIEQFVRHRTIVIQTDTSTSGGWGLHYLPQPAPLQPQNAPIVPGRAPARSRQCGLAPSGTVTFGVIFTSEAEEQIVELAIFGCAVAAAMLID